MTTKTTQANVSFYFCKVKISRNIKRKVSSFLLKKDLEVPRRRRGSNYSTAQSIAVLYKEEGEEKYRQVKDFVRYLHEEHGVRKVFAFGFIEGGQSEVPVWHAHKLEFDYFTSEDLSWNLKPDRTLKNFVREPFEILIDLTRGDTMELSWALIHSVAGMKVGRKGHRCEGQLDMVIASDEQTIDFIEQINYYLSNFNIQ